MSQHVLELDEGDRQLVLLALAQLSLANPGFDYALNLLATRIDNVKDGRAEMYDAFRALRGDLFPRLEVIERAAERLAHQIWNYERPNEGAVDEARRTVLQVLCAFEASPW